MSVFRPSGAKNYRIQFQIAGKTYVKSSKTADKRVAERMEAEWRTQIHARQYLKEREPITLNEMFESYLLQPLSEITKSNARSFFRIFRKHTNCDVNAHEFNQAELEKYVFARRKSGRRNLASGITSSSAARCRHRRVAARSTRSHFHVPRYRRSVLRDREARMESGGLEEEDDRAMAQQGCKMTTDHSSPVLVVRLP